MNFEESITFNTSKEIVTVDDFKNIYMWLIDYECPELMQINGEWNWNYVVLDEKQCITLLKPSYQMTKIQYQTALLEIGEILFNFKEKLMHKSDYEKKLYVYDYIVESVVYDAIVNFQIAHMVFSIKKQLDAKVYVKALCGVCGH